MLKIQCIRRGIIIPDTVPQKIEFAITSKGGHVVYASVKAKSATYNGMRGDKESSYFEFCVSFRNIGECTKLNLPSSELRINGERVASLNEMIEEDLECERRRGNYYITVSRHIRMNKRFNKTSAWQSEDAFLMDITYGPISESYTDTENIPDDTRVKFDFLMFTEYNLKKDTILHQIACNSILNKNKAKL